jgi:hypothetical protein
VSAKPRNLIRAKLYAPESTPDSDENAELKASKCRREPGKGMTIAPDNARLTRAAGRLGENRGADSNRRPSLR